MIKTLNLNSNYILERKHKYNLIINGNDNYTLYLPPCDTLIRIEILLINDGNITLDTNSDNVKFLSNNSRKLVIEGGLENKGKNLIIETFQSQYWRIFSTTLNDTLFTIKE